MSENRSGWGWLDITKGRGWVVIGRGEESYGLLVWEGDAEGGWQMETTVKLR